MNILYCAKQSKGQNDNEGAVRHALSELGHHVTAVEESQAAAEWHQHCHENHDLLLFQNWKSPPNIADAPFPRVLWYFDRVEGGIPPSSANTRREWMRHVLPMTTAAYCTDGDWAASNNLRHLMQGADERQCSPPGTQKDIDILFVGNARGHSPERAQFVSHMRDRYGDRFVHIHRYFGKRLAHYVQRSRIVIAPPTPVTDRYFSNRIYIMLGLGAFLLHQQSALAASQYRDGEEIVFYNGLDDLHDKIDYWLQRDTGDIAEQGYLRTLREHTYRHRLEVILRDME